MMIRFFFLLFILFSVGDEVMPAFTERLESKEQFNQLGSDPLTSKYSKVVSVKVVYDLYQKKMFYINSDHFAFHYEFCQRYIDEDIYLSKFNFENYAEMNKHRRFLLGNINYFSDLDVYALELSPSDHMQPILIEKLLGEIRTSSFLSDDLKFMLSTQRLTDLKDKFEGEVSYVTPEDIYKNMQSQSVSEGEGIGRLRFVEDFRKESCSFRPTDILVIKETPLVLPKVAGVIVAEFQTPLSHLSILGKNRKMPVVAIKDVFSKKELLQLADTNVQLIVTPIGYEIQKTDKLASNANAASNSVQLEYDLAVDSLIGVEFLNKKSELYVGNKARNFGWLCDLSKKEDFLTPENAFAIPFHFYNQHVHQSNAAKMIEHLVNNPKDYQDQQRLQIHLMEIRKSIKTTPLNPYFLKKVEDRIESSAEFRRMRFRSSTNAEDAEGFSGAGLYASKTGEIGNPDKSVEKAIKKVWASLWSHAAYMEREYFGIDQSTVQMGVLVHRSFPSEAVNGVIITKNLYRKSYPGFVINVQVGDESVVKPRPGIVCDQLICYPHSSTNIQPDATVIDVITRSNLVDSRSVMTDDEVQHLANQADEIKLQVYRKIGRRYLYEDFGLDLEFKLDGVTRQLYIKQFRLYND